MVPAGLHPTIERVHIVPQARQDTSRSRGGGGGGGGGGTSRTAGKGKGSAAFLTASQNRDYRENYRVSTQSQVS
jgi:hypothetical protein